MKYNKLKYLIFVFIISIIFIGIFVYYNQISKFIFNFNIPKNVTQTGAILTTPTVNETAKSSQLYNLLDMGVIATENFILTPIPKKRVFEIKLLEPVDRNKEVFYKWIKENGYGDINPQKFIFTN